MNRYKGSLTIKQLIVAHEKIKAKSALELTRNRMNFINTISPSDSILRAVKKEDILTYRAKLKEMGIEIAF